MGLCSATVPRPPGRAASLGSNGKPRAAVFHSPAVRLRLSTTIFTPRRPQVAPATQSFLRRRRIIVPIANGTWREITVKTSRRACRPIGLLLRSRRCRSRSMADWRALQWPGGSIEIDAGRKLQRVQAASPHRHWKIASPSSIAPPHKSPTTDARFTGGSDPLVPQRSRPGECRKRPHDR